MAERKRLSCPVCGAEMNLHAEKVDYSGVDRAAFDPDLGGVVAEFHTCPACGFVVERSASSGATR